MKKIGILLIAFVYVISGYCQDIVIGGVNGREFKGVKALIDPATKEAKGYYTFYRLEKKGKGLATFNLGLYDDNLGLIKNVTFEVNKRTIISSSVFNGEDFMFIFDEPGKSMKYATVSSKGEKLIEQEKEAQKRWFGSTTVYPAEGGFFLVDALKEKNDEGKKLGYKITKVDNKLNEVWVSKYLPDAGMNYVENIKSVNDKLYIIHGAAPKVVFSFNSKSTVDKSLKCISNVDGKEIFTYSLFDGVHTTIPTSYYLDGANVVLGGMFFEGKKQSSKNSDGIFFTMLDASGKKMSSSTQAWDGEIQKKMKESKKGFSLGGKPKAYFHKIIKTADGNYQIISELFKKNYKPIPGGNAGTAMRISMLASGRLIGSIPEAGAIFTFEIMDFMIFEFDKDAKMVKMNIIEKEHTKVFCGEPYTTMTGLALADAVNNFGFFNYKFTHSFEGKEYMVVSNFTKKDPHIGFVKLEEI